MRITELLEIIKEPISIFKVSKYILYKTLYQKLQEGKRLQYRGSNSTKGKLNLEQELAARDRSN